MTKSQKKPWVQKWGFIEKIAKGGQGETSLVKPKNGLIINN
ncbi:MAG: hypothetical protein QNJ68_21510 [Microcoleaceae cyanobacterium MO_207.B10]|nr:hypothetical protein [Microcoleaceae cyanobacterium MO_207.B10]